MKNKKSTRLNILIVIAMVISLLVSTGIVLVNAGTDPPKPYSPKGNITDRTPTYKWKPVVSATKYRFQVIKDGVTVLTKNVNSSVTISLKVTIHMGAPAGGHLCFFSMLSPL